MITLRGYRRSWKRRVLMPMLLILAGVFAAPLTAQETSQKSAKDSTSLSFVPEDVAFYSSSLRLGEQFNNVANSEAFKQLWQLPAVQFAVQQFKSGWDEGNNKQLSVAKKILERPENQELVELLKDAFSQEVFSYGDSSFTELLVLMNQINGALRTSQLDLLDKGPGSEEILQKKMLEVLEKHADRIKISDVVVGFKLSDTKRAQNQLARLEPLNALLGQLHPKLEGRLQREKIDDANFVSLKLDGSLIPWEQVRLKLADAKLDAIRSQLEKLIEKAQKLTLVISLGIRGDYLLFSIGDSNEHLASLGKRKLLADRKELAPLMKAGNKRFTSIVYVSGDFLQSASSAEQQISQLADLAEKMLPKSDLSAAIQKELVDDAKSLRDDLLRLIPKQSAVMGFTYLTPAGYEGYAYTWPKHPRLDGSKPLSLLEHVGGNPLMFAVVRGVRDTESAGLIEKWSKRIVYYYENVGIEKLPAEQRAKVETLRTEFAPLLKRGYKNTRDVLAPALQDGQVGIVLDAKVTSTQWLQKIPATRQALPMLELGILVGVSDAAQLKKAFAEYSAIAQELLDKLHKIFPEKVAEIKIPAPKTSQNANGTLYSYPLPDSAGIDSAVEPNAAVGKDVAVLSMFPAFSNRLLEKSSLQPRGPWTGSDKPLAGAMYVNFAGMVEAASPWVMYQLERTLGGEKAAAEAGGGLNPIGLISPQIRIGLRALQCYQGSSSVWYYEDGALVQRGETRFADLKP